MFQLQLDFLPKRAWFALFALAAFGLVAAGMIIQSIESISPCPLCIFQRVLYLVVGTVALFGVLAPFLSRVWGGLMAAVSLGGMGVAGYQTWMQAFPGMVNECSYTDPDLIERLVDWLGMQWPSLFMATGFCSSRDWVFLGLSMANWSVLVFAGFVAVGVLLVRRRF